MKIKTDFVTNSSSSSFIVFIPESYKLHKNRIEGSKEYKEYIEMEEPNLKDRVTLMDELIKLMNLLKDGKEVTVGPYGYEGLILFEVLEKDCLVFKIIDVDGEGASTISPISLDEIKNFISRIEKL